MNKQDPSNTSVFDFDPICAEDGCFHTDTANNIHALLDTIDGDWSDGSTRDHTNNDTNFVLGAGGGLSAQAKYNRFPADYSWGMWSYIGPHLEGPTTLTADFYDWLPSHSESIDDDTTSEATSGEVYANYKCVPSGNLLKPWEDAPSVEDGWIWYSDNNFDEAIEEIFETNKTKYLFKAYQNLYKSGSLYLDARGWDDDKTAHEQLFVSDWPPIASGLRAYDGSNGISKSNPEDYAAASGRNPLWLMAKGCCSNVLKIERGSGDIINKVKVSCDEPLPEWA